MVLPVALLLILQLFGDLESTFSVTSLAPGITLFGFVMLMFTAAMVLSRDRDTALFSRMLTTPLRSQDFVSGYSLPYLPVAVVQGLVLFGVGAWLGIEMNGSPWLVIMVLLLMAVLYIGLGMLTGVMFSMKQVPFVYTAVLLLTIFGGAWMDLKAIGGVFQTVGEFFPFAHAIYAVRDVMIEGAGLGDIATDLFWVIGYTLLTVAAAVLVFRRRMVE
jgi:ABC-2 type transport system permease protein